MEEVTTEFKFNGESVPPNEGKKSVSRTSRSRRTKTCSESNNQEENVRETNNPNLINRSQSLNKLKYRMINAVSITTNRSVSVYSTSSDSHIEDSTKRLGFKSYSRQQKLTLLCLALIHFGVYLSMSIIAPFFPVEAELKGMSMSVTGYVFSSYAFVMFLASPFMGKVLTIAGVKFTLVSGIFLASGCNILFGAINFIHDDTMFTIFCFVLRSVEALGATAFFTAAWTTIAEVFPDDISYVFGLMETFVGLGMSVGPALGGALYSLGGYELPFYSLGSFMMATVPVCLIILPDPQIKEDLDDSNSPSLLKLLSVPRVLIVSLVVTVLCGIWGFLDPTLEPHLSDFGVKPETTGLLFLLMAATYSITCPIIGRIGDKWGYKYTMMSIGSLLTGGCLLLMGPSVALPFIHTNMSLNTLALLLLGITLGIGVIPTFQAMLDAAYEGGFEENTVTYGLISSVFSATSSLGEFLGPSVGGVLFEYYSFDFACTCIAIATATTAVVVAISILFRRTYEDNKSEWSNSTSTSSHKRPRVSLTDSGVFASNERTPLLTSSI